MKLKKTVSLMLCLLMVFGMTLMSSAQSNEKILRGDELQKFVEENNLIAPNGKEITEIVTTIDDDEARQAADKTAAEFMESYSRASSSTWSFDYQNSGYACGTDSIMDDEYQGPISTSTTLTETISSEYSTTVSASLGLDEASINAGTGSKLTKTYSVDKKFELSADEGETLYITVYPKYKVYTYDVYYTNFLGKKKKVGFIDIFVPKGICVTQYTE